MVEVIYSGYVKVSGYAKKIRRVMNGAFRGKVDLRHLNEKISEINKMLYKKMVEELGFDKDDVVMIVIPYKFEDGEIDIIFDEIEIRHYKFDNVYYVKDRNNEKDEQNIKKDKIDWFSRR